MTDLKLCPLCKSEPQLVDMLIDDEISHKSGVACSNGGCAMHQPFYLHEWQSRPIEDDLRNQIVLLNAEINALASELQTIVEENKNKRIGE